LRISSRWYVLRSKVPFGARVRFGFGGSASSARNAATTSALALALALALATISFACSAGLCGPNLIAMVVYLV
jgi:hypothetical protein